MVHHHQREEGRKEADWERKKPREKYGEVKSNNTYSYVPWYLYDITWCQMTRITRYQIYGGTTCFVLGVVMSDVDVVQPAELDLHQSSRNHVMHRTWYYKHKNTLILVPDIIRHITLTAVMPKPSAELDVMADNWFQRCWEASRTSTVACRHPSDFLVITIYSKRIKRGWLSAEFDLRIDTTTTTTSTTILLLPLLVLLLLLQTTTTTTTTASTSTKYYY